MAWLILAILGAAALSVWQKWHRVQSVQNTALLGGLLLVMSMIFVVEKLRWEIGGVISLGRAKQDVLEAARIAITAAALVGDGSRYLGGITPEHGRRLEKYAAAIDEIAGVTAGTLLAEIRTEIREAGEAYEAKLDAFQKRLDLLKWCSEPLPDPPPPEPCVGRDWDTFILKPDGSREYLYSREQWGLGVRAQP